MKKGILYIVATPIGNLSDISNRAIETLKSVDVIACEDTRISGTMLANFDIKKKLISLHQHSSENKINQIVEILKLGGNVAYISDNGTPGISDPGQELVGVVKDTNHCHSEQSEESHQIGNRSFTDVQDDIKIIPIPGASALTAAISVSGFIEKEFYFAGFLPKKKGRQTKFKTLSLLDCPIVIYESAIRLAKTLNDILTYFGSETEVFIAREMTKMFEEYWSGNINSVISDLDSHKLKGEVVLIVKKNNCEK